MSTLPGPLPLNSEKFLPPATCKHKNGDETFLKEQNADRERMVCGVGLDIHYELNVVANESGAYQPRLKPFNPRMSGPACPYNYTGKFIKEDEYVGCQDDPIELGRKIAEKKPYDEQLYLKRDPRLVSKTVIIRDYGCKIPIELSETEKIARAVLVNYPDQYIGFLSEFVSNLFGTTMRKFLTGYITGLKSLISNPDELNKVSWGAYVQVQGGVDPYQAAETSKSHKISHADCSLQFNTAILDNLNKLNDKGRAMTGQCSAQDVYDLRPCIAQHIATLEEMRDTYCRAFGSKEEHVVAMLFYANEQGRKMCHDMMLLEDSDVPKYDKISLHVPTNIFKQSENVETSPLVSPDANPRITKDCADYEKSSTFTHSVRLSVGKWQGTADANFIFMSASNKAPYQWGWGHAANVFMRLRHYGDITHTLLAPYLPYKGEYNPAEGELCINSLQDIESLKAYTRDNIHKTRFECFVDATTSQLRRHDDTSRSRLTTSYPGSAAPPRRSLRDSLEDPPAEPVFNGVRHETAVDRQNEPRVYRGAESQENAVEDHSAPVAAGYFRSDVDNLFEKLPLTQKPEHSSTVRTTFSSECATPGEFNIVETELMGNQSTCDFLDPALTGSGRCVPSNANGYSLPFYDGFGPYSLKTMMEKPLFDNTFGNMKLPNTPASDANRGTLWSLFENKLLHRHCAVKWVELRSKAKEFAKSKMNRGFLDAGWGEHNISQRAGLVDTAENVFGPDYKRSLAIAARSKSPYVFVPVFPSETRPFDETTSLTELMNDDQNFSFPSDYIFREAMIELGSAAEGLPMGHRNHNILIPWDHSTGRTNAHHGDFEKKYPLFIEHGMTLSHWLKICDFVIVDTVLNNLGTILHFFNMDFDDSSLPEKASETARAKKVHETIKFKDLIMCIPAEACKLDKNVYGEHLSNLYDTASSLDKITYPIPDQETEKTVRKQLAALRVAFRCADDELNFGNDENDSYNSIPPTTLVPYDNVDDHGGVPATRTRDLHGDEVGDATPFIGKDILFRDIINPLTDKSGVALQWFKGRNRFRPNDDIGDNRLPKWKDRIDNDDVTYAKYGLFKIAIVNMMMKWMDMMATKCDGSHSTFNENNIASLSSCSGFHLLAKFGTNKSVRCSPVALVGRYKLDKWPYRVLAPPNNRDVGMSVPFLSMNQIPEALRSSSLLDFSKVRMPDDAKITWDFFNPQSILRDPAASHGLKLFALRMISSMSAGMFITTYLFHDVFLFDTTCRETIKKATGIEIFFPDVVGSYHKLNKIGPNGKDPYGEMMAKEWNNRKSFFGNDITFSWDKKSCKLKMKSNNKDLKPNEANALIYRAAYRNVMDRIFITTSSRSPLVYATLEQDFEKLREHISLYAPNEKMDSPTMHFLIEYGVQDIPTDMIMQMGGSNHLCPMLLHCASGAVYKNQYMRFKRDNRKAFDCVRDRGLDAEPFKTFMSNEIRKYTAVLTTLYHEYDQKENNGESVFKGTQAPEVQSIPQSFQLNPTGEQREPNLPVPDEPAGMPPILRALEGSVAWVKWVNSTEEDPQKKNDEVMKRYIAYHTIQEIQAGYGVGVSFGLKKLDEHLSDRLINELQDSILQDVFNPKNEGRFLTALKILKAFEFMAAFSADPEITDWISDDLIKKFILFHGTQWPLFADNEFGAKARAALKTHDALIREIIKSLKAKTKLEQVTENSEIISMGILASKENERKIWASLNEVLKFAVLARVKQDTSWKENKGKETVDQIQLAQRMIVSPLEKKLVSVRHDLATYTLYMKKEKPHSYSADALNISDQKVTPRRQHSMRDMPPLSARTTPRPLTGGGTKALSSSAITKALASTLPLPIDDPSTSAVPKGKQRETATETGSPLDVHGLSMRPLDLRTATSDLSSTSQAYTKTYGTYETKGMKEKAGSSFSTDGKAPRGRPPRPDAAASTQSLTNEPDRTFVGEVITRAAELAALVSNIRSADPPARGEKRSTRMWQVLNKQGFGGDPSEKGNTLNIAFVEPRESPVDTDDSESEAGSEYFRSAEQTHQLMGERILEHVQRTEGERIGYTFFPFPAFEKQEIGDGSAIDPDFGDNLVGKWTTPSSKGGWGNLKLLPVHGTKFTEFYKSQSQYNVNAARPQFFAVLDAAGLLWHARSFVNPADSLRPSIEEESYDGEQPCDVHPWGLILCETFTHARETFLTKYPHELFENEVKSTPGRALPFSMIGALCDASWTRYFPLLPKSHPLRDRIRRIRALDVLWGTLPSYTSGSGAQNFTTSNGDGAWMPLSPALHAKLLASVDLFDKNAQIPTNPWIAHGGQGISRVFNQSYHSVYHTDSFRAPHFKQWVNEALKVQAPRPECFYPFSQYGGTPVLADFSHHCVEAPSSGNADRHHQLMYNRFGFYTPLRIGAQYNDGGLLQDMFMFKYRPYANLTLEQRGMPDAKEVWPSNFMSYARTHAIIALASCNHGTEEVSLPRSVRNLYRLYVDTYQCMGVSPDDDGVPCIMGFNPSAIQRKDDRPVILYAGSLSCLNTKLEIFCNSSANANEKVCPLYKQVYLNDATLLFTRLLRAERRKILHMSNYKRAKSKRGGRYQWTDFQKDLIDLQDAYIEFLQTTLMGLLIETGADMNNVPLHLLEPRELEVSLHEEDDNVIGNDFLTPRTREIIQDMDFSEDNLSRSQLAILSLIPPNHRILGTLRLNQSTQIIDMEHIKKQIQKETMSSNKKVWQRYTEALVAGAFGQRILEPDGPIDFSFDMSAIKDPLRESENIRKQFTTTNAQSSSSLSQTIRGNALRKGTGPNSIVALNSSEMETALQAVRDRVERDHARNGMPKVKCLALLKIPEHIKRMLREDYEEE